MSEIILPGKVVLEFELEKDSAMIDILIRVAVSRQITFSKLRLKDKVGLKFFLDDEIACYQFGIAVGNATKPF